MSYRPPMRLRYFLLCYALACGLNLALAVRRLVEGTFHGSAYLSLGAFFICLLSALQVSRHSIRPRQFRLKQSSVRELADADLDLLEKALGLTIRPEQKGRFFVSDIVHARAALADPDSDPINGQLKLETQAALDRLLRAGLLTDRRFNRRDSYRCYSLNKDAAEILAEEQRRRSQIAPLGPRSRPGALAG